MFTKIKFSILCVYFVALVVSASDMEEEKRGSTPLQLSLYCPIQMVPEDNDVYGLRLNLPYGVNHSVYGLDIGLWNTTTGDQYGFQVGAIGVYREGRTFGWNFAGIVNLSSGNETGVSFAGIYNQSEGKVTGLQFGGIASKAKHVRGLQFGLVNYSEDITGIQLGLVNICPKSSVPFMLLINAKY